MPTPILNPRGLSALFVFLACGCTTLRPLDERAPLDGDLGIDAALDAGTDAGADSGFGAGDAGDAGDLGSDAGFDAGLDAGIDAGGVGCVVPGSCTCTPNIGSLGLRVVAHGARLTFSGTCFTDANTVRIGGVDQTFTVDSDGQITVPSVAETSPLGATQPVVVVSPVGTSPAVSTPVVHLVIDELDSVTNASGTQRLQFIEISAGIDAALDLGDYMIVLIDGLDDGVHAVPPGVVLGTTAANGRFLVGGSMLPGVQATIAVDALTAGTGVQAAVLYQGSTLPAATATISQLTAPMIDAMVYAATNVTSDSGLLAACYPVVGDRVQANEDANAAALTESIRRCGATRRAGTAYVTGSPSPGNPNVCP